MWNYLWPLLLVVGANTLYNIFAKGTAENVQPFATLTVTYLTAALVCLALFFVTSESKQFFSQLRNLNWNTFALSASIIGVEFGYIQFYRAGWTISTGPMVANTALACVLLILGVLLYKEVLHLNQLLGMLLCVAGLVLINH